MPFAELIDAVTRLLSTHGLFSLILPKDGYEMFCEIAKLNGLYEQKRIEIRPNFAKVVHRVISCWALCSNQTEVEELIIEVDGRHNYSQKYKKLTKEFYLKF